jgi:polyhydroxybutyrate depolymerase
MISERRRGLVAALAVLVLLLCLIAVAAGAFWTTGSSLRCAVPAHGPAQPGWSARTLVSNGRVRCYHLYIPPGHDPAQPAPVVVSLHGYVLNPDIQALISGWHKLADREGFVVVVYAQGTSYPRRWNAGDTWGADGVDDVLFFRDLVDDLSALAAVDRSRVYVNGFSNGGGMSVRIGCDAADAVAAIGSVAGAVVNMAACKPSRPVPAMAFHGTADWVVPYDGGVIRVLPLRYGAELTQAPSHFVGAEAWVATLAGLNGCDPTAEILPPQGDVRGRRYAGCDQDAETILYTIEDGGHQWPGGTTIPGAGKNSKHIDATEEMWRFFQTYRLEQ